MRDDADFMDKISGLSGLQKIWRTIQRELSEPFAWMEEQYEPSGFQDFVVDWKASEICE